MKKSEIRSSIIQGYGKNKYKVFEDGTVVSLGRIGARGYIVKDKILTPHPNSNNYLRVSMNLSGKNKDYFVHRLVAECFIPNPDNKRIVNHKDGNKSNNNASNLEWATSSENNRHAFRTGLKTPTMHIGKDNWNSKLDEYKAEWIKEHYIKGDKTYGQTALARKFGVAQSSIWAVINNKSWRAKEVV